MQVGHESLTDVFSVLVASDNSKEKFGILRRVDACRSMLNERNLRIANLWSEALDVMTLT